MINEVVIVTNPGNLMGPGITRRGSLGLVLGTKEMRWPNRTSNMVRGYVLIQISEHTRERLDKGLPVCIWIQVEHVQCIGPL